MTCAFAVRGAIQKMPGVERVEVSLNQGLATIQFKPGNTLEPGAVWETVRKNGFTPKETSVLVRGQVQGRQLRVSGTNQVLDLIADGKNPKVLEVVALRGVQIVTLRGKLVPQKDLKVKVPLQVEKIEEGK